MPIGGPRGGVKVKVQRESCSEVRAYFLLNSDFNSSSGTPIGIGDLLGPSGTSQGVYSQLLCVLGEYWDIYWSIQTPVLVYKADLGGFMTKYWLQIRFQRTILMVWEFTPMMGGQKPPKPQTDNLGTIILMHIRLTQDDLCKKIPVTFDHGLRPLL